ncbi:MAG: acyl-CoA dehydrogenase family protein [Syntrophales bacterium]|jgi:acyl-CoA dehydrogenase|nr:acyl-CoA dehydrogenase family protein [Syntrophales bacterium]
MANHINKDLIEFIKEVSNFAREEIAPWVAQDNHDEFPTPLWRKLGDAGLLGIAIPREYGGLGRDYLAITLAAEAVVAQGGCLGIGLSWMIHNVVARLVFAKLGSEGQRSRYLPGLAQGRITASISISEPDVGAHPKYLKTRADHRGDGYVVNGEKAYLTNGPFVDLYVVLAVTGADATGTKKQFSALIVPKETPGVTMTAPMKLANFKPSPHCGITLVNCEIPAENLIGTEGTAYPDIAIAFREIEDVTLMGLVLGGINRQMSLLLKELRRQEGTVAEDLPAALCRLQYLRDTLRLIACEAARILDGDDGHEDLLSLVLSFRDLARQFQEGLEKPAAATLLTGNQEFLMLSSDLVRAVNLARNVMTLKQIKQGHIMLRGA